MNLYTFRIARVSGLRYVMNARATVGKDNREGSLDQTSHYIYMNMGITKHVIQREQENGHRGTNIQAL